MLLNEMEIFYYVVNLKSFSKAADKLNVSKSYISKKITHLEESLKIRLLARSTRALVLTPQGNAFYEHCQKIIEEHQKAYMHMNALQEKPSGRLKISAPPALGFYLLPNLLEKFSMTYPDIMLEVNCDSHWVPVIQESYDVVLRFGKLKSSELISQRISTIKTIMCGSQQYFKKNKTPDSPKDLNNHLFCIYNGNDSGKKIKASGKEYSEIINLKSVFSSNQLELIKKMVLKGKGLGMFPEFMVSEELKNKKLIRCLKAYDFPDQVLYAVYPNRKLLSVNVKLFLAMIKKHLVLSL